jgi:hypothetical protein
VLREGSRRWFPGIAEGTRRAQEVFKSVSSLEDIERVVLTDKRIYSHLRRSDPRLRPTSLHQPSCLGSRIRMCSLTVRPRPRCPHAPHHLLVIVPATSDG